MRVLLLVLLTACAAFAQTPSCSNCTQPTKLPVYRDGRFFCASCKKNCVFTQSQAEAVTHEIVVYLQGLLGSDALKPPPPMKLCDKDELQTKFVESGRAMDVAGFYRPYNPEMVYLLSGTDAVELKAVLSHELTHAWESRNCASQDRAVSEGFACWTQYHYLQSIGKTLEAEQLTRHQDPDYGASLVKLLALEKKLGQKGLIAWVKKARNF